MRVGHISPREAHGEMRPVYYHELATRAAASDEMLLRRLCRDQDELVLHLLRERHQLTVWTACWRVLEDWKKTEEACQEAWLVLRRKAKSFQEGQSFANWLYGIATRVALNVRKQWRRRQQCEHCRDAVEAVQPARPDELAELHELEELIAEEAQRLPAHYRAAFVCCGLEGRTTTEAAEQMGCLERTAASRWARAKRMVWERLARRGVVPPWDDGR